MNPTEDYGSIVDEEEIEVGTHKPVGGIVSVRFAGDELKTVIKAANDRGVTVTDFLHEAVLGYLSVLCAMSRKN